MSHLQLTPQQREAIFQRDVSIALSAGAGCGKTFVLTQRFLTHLRPEHGPDPLGRIVAITFTERAAREMRDRVRAVCHAELERCSSEEVEHWQQVLRGLDSARISTIHAFCASLLRSHAVEVGVDPGFGLLDEATGDAFVRRAVNDAIYELLTEHDEDCMDLVLHFGLERARDLVRDLVLGRFQVDFDWFREVTTERLAAEWQRRWHEDFLPRRLRHLAESDLVQALLRLLRENEPSHPEMQRRRKALLDGLPRLAETTDPQTLLEELRGCAQVRGGGGKKAWENEDVYETVRDLLKSLRAEIDKLRKDFQLEPAEIETAARFSLTALRVTERVAGFYEASKREAALLDFDDLLLRARDLLRSSGSVRRQIAEGIDFLLVDEFQDTDPVQADIARMLCEDRLDTGKLFIVGDAKQSIYRFRRADPNVFTELRGELPERGRLPLSTNFRSQPEILKFVNALFGSAMGPMYERLVPHDDRQLSPTPAVEFLFATPDAQAEDGRETSEQRRQREADWLARRIAALLEDETPRIRQRNEETGETELRPVRRGDVAILFRTLSNVAIYEEALRRYDLDYYLVGGRAFFAQQEIFDVANLCRFLDDPDDEVALVGALRSPFFSLSDDTLFTLADRFGSLRSALEGSPPEELDARQRERVGYASAVLRELRGAKDRLPLADLLNLALERTGYDASLLNEFLGRRKLANLRKLIDMARQFDRSGLYTLKDFVERITESITEQTDEELAATQPETGENVIRLMTIHQAKGLEFPVVFVADMAWTRRGGTGSAVFHPELGPLFPLPRQHGESPRNPGLEMHRDFEDREDEAETVRLLYVATTRAADYLVLSAGLDADRTASSPWLKLLARRFDLQTGLPAVDPYLGRLSLGEIAPEEIPAIRVHHRAPDVVESTVEPSRRELPLQRFRQAVEAAEPAPLPDKLREIPPRIVGPCRLTVSQIEEVDAELRSEAAPLLHWSPQDAETSEPDVTAPKDQRLLGTLVHAVLERLDFQKPEALPRLIDRCSLLLEEPVTGDVQSAALARLQRFVRAPVIRDLATARRCFRELEFLLRWPTADNGEGNTNIAGTIDCLFESGHGAWTIFDYKTAHLPAGKAAEVLRAYELQLAVYALAARDFLDRLPDRAEIVLLDTRVRRLPLTLDETTLESIRHRVGRAVQRLREPSVDLRSEE